MLPHPAPSQHGAAERFESAHAGARLAGLLAGLERLELAVLTHRLLKGLVDAEAVLGARLDQRHPHAHAFLERLVLRHLPLLYHVHLVGDHDDWHLALDHVLDAQQLLVVLVELLEGSPVGDGEDEQEAVAVPHPRVPHHREVVLARGVKHLHQHDLVVNRPLAAVAVLDRRIVKLEKEALYVLDGKRGLADAARAHHTELDIGHCGVL
mmetsp:Transcript_62328/g.171234  ORF Transcript_62328/g.171234 Transcript_62328/m.171234 type:complete len:209 (+) Transcript_62328:342-968(+)